MEGRTNRRHGHRVAIFPEQRGEGTGPSQGHGGPVGRCGGRLHSATSGSDPSLSLHRVHFTGISQLSVSSDEFRAVLGRFPSGVTVVTTRGADGSDHGMTVSAFCSVSLQPPLVLICIEKTATAHNALKTAPGFVVNILSAKQEQIARRFSIV